MNYQDEQFIKGVLEDLQPDVRDHLLSVFTISELNIEIAQDLEQALIDDFEPEEIIKYIDESFVFSYEDLKVQKSRGWSNGRTSAQRLRISNILSPREYPKNR